METMPVLPQEPEANAADTPMSYSLGSSNFGLLPESEGSSLKLFASVALVSVILAGTFFIAVGIRRPAQAKAAESPQVKTTQGTLQVASNVTPAPPIPDLKTVDSVGLATTTTLPKTEAVVPTAVLPTAASPQMQAQVTMPAKVTAQAPAAKVSVKADKENARPGAGLAQKRAMKSAKPAVAAKAPQDSSNLMTVMPDPTPQVEHHAAAATPTAVPAKSSAVKSAEIPVSATRAHKQVASANVSTRIKPVDMGKTSTGKIATAGIPATAGTGLVGARGAVSSTGIPAGTVELTQAEASKKVASAGIPAATALTVPSKRTVAPAPANLDMVSRRSSGPTKPNK